ncbi:MAG: folate-binding protein YgfZ [Acidobacteriota bacterium]
MTREEWRAWLCERGAESGADGQAVVSFGAPDEERRAALAGAPRIADLSHRALLVIEGADAGTFLQNQITGDLSSAGDGALLTSIAQANGRVIALFRLLADDGRWLLTCRADAADALRARLALMRLRARVEIADAGEAVGQVAIAGLADGPAVEGVRVAPLAEASATSPWWLACGPWDRLAALWEALEPVCRPVGWPAWRLAEIAAGVPDLPGALAERFLPQFLDLERLGGLSYAKGCFPGQEVIARTHYLGRTVRRLVAAQTHGAPPVPGAAIRTAANREAGTVLDAVPRPDSGAQVQAVVRVEALDAGEALFVAGDEHAPLRIMQP